MTTVLLGAYPDPDSGFPPLYVRSGLPRLRSYGDGRPLPNPSATDFRPGALLGSVSGTLGLASFLHTVGARLVVTDDVAGADSAFRVELTAADVIVVQPSWPPLLDAAAFDAARRLRLVVVAGDDVSSVDMAAAARHGVVVAAATGSTVASVAEHTVAVALSMVRDLPNQSAFRSPVADAVRRSYDIEGFTVAVAPADSVGVAVLRRFAAFDVRLRYTNPLRLDPELEHALGASFYPDFGGLLDGADLLAVHVARGAAAPKIDAQSLARLRRGAYVVMAGGPGDVDVPAVIDALRSGQLAGVAGDLGDVGDVGGAEPNLRYASTRTAGDTLSAQTRIAAAVREILESFLDGGRIDPAYILTPDVEATR